MYTAIFTPYVAAFLLNEPDYNSRKSKKYGEDPIVIIDLIGKLIQRYLPVSTNIQPEIRKWLNAALAFIILIIIINGLRDKKNLI